MDEHGIPLLPGGYGRSSLVVGERSPRADSGCGYEITDDHGNRLIDLNNNFTVLVHGHAHHAIVEEAKRAVELGASFGLPNEHELMHARALLARIPSADQVRYTNSGTEAVMTAFRLARAATGRDRIVLIDSAYHGTSDVALIALGERGRRGVPAGVLEDTLLVRLNDVDNLRETVVANASTVAAIALDLIPNRAGLLPLTEEFAHAARTLATEIGAVLILDEVISFRMAHGGMQQLYDIVPDLTVLGKLIGGGFPVGAIVGREAVMRLLNPLVEDGLIHGGTFSANPLSMRAGLRALELLDEDALTSLNALGEYLRETLGRAIGHLPWEIRGWGSLVRLFPLGAGDAAELQRLLWWGAYRRGLLLMPTGLMALSTPMTRDVCDRIVEELAGALEEVEVMQSHPTNL
jgi:glutamate-1-semialdehyde 2,1-aminomutase